MAVGAAAVSVVPMVSSLPPRSVPRAGGVDHELVGWGGRNLRRPSGPARYYVAPATTAGLKVTVSINESLDPTSAIGRAGPNKGFGGVSALAQPSQAICLRDTYLGIYHIVRRYKNAASKILRVSRVNKGGEWSGELIVINGATVACPDMIYKTRYAHVVHGEHQTSVLSGERQ